MPEIKCDWFSCYWINPVNDKCTYDGTVYLLIAKEDNPVGDLLECEQYLFLSQKERKARED